MRRYAFALLLMGLFMNAPLEDLANGNVTPAGEVGGGATVIPCDRAALVAAMTDELARTRTASLFLEPWPMRGGHDGVLGEGVEERVAGGVVALPRAAEHPGGGGYALQHGQRRCLPLDMALDDFLSLYPSQQKVYNRWIKHPIAIRMAAYSFVLADTSAKNELTYGIQAIEKNGFGNNTYTKYLRNAEKAVNEKDLEVELDG